MVEVDDFRADIKGADPVEIVDKYLLSPGAAHVSDESIAYIQDIVARAYSVPAHTVQIKIMGSAKLGFSLVQKRRDGTIKPRYRSFSGASDIDVAVISGSIQDILIHELSVYFHGLPWWPPRPGKLADYLICGWLRPDLFPKGAGLLYCDEWFSTFRRLSTMPRFRPNQVRGGLFLSEQHLRSYMMRAVKECISLEDGL